MLSFDYTIDLQLSETLSVIDRVRANILSLPMSPKTELRLQWESLTIRTWATLALAGHDVPKHHVATILAHAAKSTRATATLYAIREAYEYIHMHWRANPKPIPISTLQTLFSLLSPESSFSELEKPLSELLTYLSQENAHPVIQASIAHIHIRAIPKETDTGLFARMTHYLILTKYGYDLRGYVTPDRMWQEDAKIYERLLGLYTQTRHMTHWLSFMTESMRKNLELLYGDLQESRFHVEFPKSFWELSDRQKQILRMLEAPDATITNRQVAKHFTVSSITASRDLAKLTSLGLLYPHGKGRSVYYTKI